jgi:adenylate cyclase
VRVVGINTPLRLYELLAVYNRQSAANIETVEQWEKAINLYEQRNFKDALRLLKPIMENNPADKTAELYAGRCMEYIAYPPPDNWDAVNNLTEK